MTDLTLSLLNPNTLLPHRAGMAGLALALSAIPPETAPLGWTVTEEAVNLSWEGSDREAIEWLTHKTYCIEDGYLNPPVLKLDRQSRYTFTQGVTSTLLQHNQQRTLEKQAKPLRFPVDPNQPEIELSYKDLLDCYYTGDFKDAFTSKGKFKDEIPIKGHHLPGLVECFVNGPYLESPVGFVSLLFLPLSCGYYALPAGRSALVIPEVKNLKNWVRLRRKSAGTSYIKFKAGGAGESGLRFLIQQQTVDDGQIFGLEYCEVYQLGKQAWDKNQNYLKQAVYRVKTNEDILAIYASAEQFFPVRFRTTDKGQTWVATSQALPWIADNLIGDRPWYSGFFEFLKKNKLFERQGLAKMTQFLSESERLLFQSVHDAFGKFRAGQFKARSDQMGGNLTKEQGWDVAKRSADKAIYRLQRPATQQEFAKALVDFLAQYRPSAAKGEGLEIYAWLHTGDNWRKARDLALLAIATYKKKTLEGTGDPDLGVDEIEPEEDSEGFEYTFP